MSGQYTIVRDSYSRLRAQVTPSFAVGIKLLAEDHPRRVEYNVHAYVVADIATELGPWRIRDIRVMWSAENKQHFIRYRQWKTGKVRENRDEWLDVAGPLDRETRAKIAEAILGVFQQIKDEAAAGTLARPDRQADVSTSALGARPEVVAALEKVKEGMEPAAEGSESPSSKAVAVEE